LGKKASERIGQLAGLPDHPESNVQWMLDMFPENAERKTLQQVPLLTPESEISVATHTESPGAQTDATITR
jgi:hypothetical protein